MVKKIVTLETIDKKVDVNATQIGRLTTEIRTLSKITNRLVGAFADFKQSTENRFDNLEEKVDLLPTKDEYFTHEAKLMKELKDTRDEQRGTQGLYETVTKRIEIIDKKLGINSLTLAY